MEVLLSETWYFGRLRQLMGEGSPFLSVLLLINLTRLASPRWYTNELNFSAWPNIYASLVIKREWQINGIPVWSGHQPVPLLTHIPRANHHLHQFSTLGNYNKAIWSEIGFIRLSTLRLYFLKTKVIISLRLDFHIRASLFENLRLFWIILQATTAYRVEDIKG